MCHSSSKHLMKRSSPPPLLEITTKNLGKSIHSFAKLQCDGSCGAEEEKDMANKEEHGNEWEGKRGNQWQR